MDELTKDLLQSRHQLQATEEEMRGKEEETAMVRLVMQQNSWRVKMLAVTPLDIFKETFGKFPAVIVAPNN